MDMIKLIDGQPVPYSEAAFRAANRHTAYGPVVSSRHLNAQGVYRVSKLPDPEVPVGQKAVLDAMPTQADQGHWVLGWTLVALSDIEARAMRDSLLASTDWTANSDVTMSDEMRVYRQALRDITDQPGFPTDVTWPTKP